VRKPSLLRLLLLAVWLPSFAGTYRLWVASQQDWEVKRGFYIGFENSSENEAPCRWQNLSLVLGVADGKEWRFISLKPNWQLGKDYSLRVGINGESAKLFLDGELEGESKGGFAPAKGQLLVYFSPFWSRSRVDYLIILESLGIKSPGKELRFSFPQRVPLLLFEPQCPQRLEWETKGEIELSASFTIVPYPDLEKLSPFIDRYGQCIYADWKGKIKSDGGFEKGARGGSEAP